MNTNDRVSAYPITAEMIEEAHRSIKLSEYYNKLFGYPKNSTMMSEEVIRIIDSIISDKKKVAGE